MIRNFFPCSTSWATYSRKRENGRVGDDDVGLFQERDALGAAEVAAGYLSSPFKAIRAALFRFRKSFDVVDVGRAVSVLIFHMLEDDSDRLGLLALAIALVVFRE